MLKAVYVWILDLFFPPRCALCDEVIARFYRPLCPDCQAGALPYIEEKRCKKCGRGKEQCACKITTLLSDGIAAPFYYKDKPKEAILRYKRTEDTDRTAYFVSELTKTAYLAYADMIFDVVTAVPMHPRSEAKRGFDQVKPVAKAVAKALHVPYSPLLRKSIYTKPQKSQYGSARAANLLGAFDVLDGTAVKDKRILLIDDVVTTAATTNECAKMLKIYGAKAVYVLAMAVSEHKKEQNDIEKLMKEKRREKTNDR